MIFKGTFNANELSAYALLGLCQFRLCYIWR